MITEPLSLYKLMILYLLNCVNYPLTNNQFSSFFLEYEYTTYFTLQQAINELLESKLIRSHSTQNSTRYFLNTEGMEALNFFESDIPSGAISDMDKFLKANKMKIRAESSSYTNYHENRNGSYVVHGEVRERNSLLFSVDINVPDKEIAQQICSKWSEKNQKIYAYTMKQLLS